MTHRFALALALAMVAASAAAGAQTLPWPTDAPKPQQQTAPWPGSAPSSQPTAMPAPGAPMGGGPMGGGPMGGAQMGGAPPAGIPQECVAQFNAHREEVQKRGIAAKAAGEKKVSREEMCKVVTSYATAEAKWVKYTQDNQARCGIPKDAVDQIKGVHAKTAEIRKQICSAAAQGGAPAAPSLSDALGTTRLPAETEKRKPGGTMDTLTGNALTR